MLLVIVIPQPVIISTQKHRECSRSCPTWKFLLFLPHLGNSWTLFDRPQAFQKMTRSQLFVSLSTEDKAIAPLLMYVDIAFGSERRGPVSSKTQPQPNPWGLRMIGV